MVLPTLSTERYVGQDLWENDIALKITTDAAEGRLRPGPRSSSTWRPRCGTRKPGVTEMEWLEILFRPSE